MKHEFEYEIVASFRLKGIIFTCASQWNGLEEWRDTQGRVLVVSRRPAGFSAAFNNALGVVTREPERLRIVSGSPELIAELQAQ